MPSSWAASSKRVNRPFSKATTLAGGISDDIAVKPTRSAKATVTSAKPSAMPCSPPRSRLAIGAGRTFSRSSSFSRFLFSMTTFFWLMSSIMPLKARQSWPISSRVRTGTWTSVSPAAKRRTPAVSSRNGPSSERDSQAPVTITTSSAMAPTIMRSRSSWRTGRRLPKSRSWRSAPI